MKIIKQSPSILAVTLGIIATVTSTSNSFAKKLLAPIPVVADQENCLIVGKYTNEGTISCRASTSIQLYAWITLISCNIAAVGFFTPN